MKKQYNSLAIDISNKCNLNCTYCFETREGNQVFPLINTSVLYKGIDFFLCNMIPDKIRDVHFHFGRREPLMNFPLLRQVVNYLEKKGLERSFRPYFHLTTNGTYLSTEINKFLKEHNFDIRVSLDGFSEVHDKNRKFKNGTGSFNKIIANIEALKKEGNRFTINSVYYPQTSFHSVYNFFNSIGVERVDFFPLWIHDSKAKGYFEYTDIYRMRRDIENLAIDQVERIMGKGLYGLTRIVQIENYLQYLCGYKRSLFYCGAGRNYIGISVNGDFYPCLKFINTSRWLLGNCSKGIDYKILTSYLEKGAPPVSELAFCQNCSIRYVCKGFCYVDRINLKNYSKSMSFYCYFQKTLFKAAESLYNAFKETRPEVIVSLAGLPEVLLANE